MPTLTASNLSYFFPDFTTVNVDSAAEIIQSMNSKSCILDAIPTDLLKKFLPDVIDYLVAILNSSFETSSVPKRYKHAVIRPLLKKAGLDAQELKNYRPVWNVCFEHKFLKNFVLNQLDAYLSQFDLYAKFQSAYRRFHSCETALLRVRNDVLVSLDNHL